MALNAPLLGGGPSTRGLNASFAASYRASRASLFESVELPERDVVAKAQELKQKFDKRAVKRARRFRWGKRADADESESRDLKGELQMVRGLRLRASAPPRWAWRNSRDLPRIVRPSTSSAWSSSAGICQRMRHR